MKNLASFILLLAISTSQKVFSCYFYPYGEEIRFSLFNPTNFNYDGFLMYNYCSSKFYSDNYTTQENTITENDLMWYNHTQKKVSIPEIKTAVFEIPANEINIRSKNLFIQYLYKTNDIETINYLIFAKESEKLITTSEELWESASEIDDKVRFKKIELAKQKIISVKNTILKKRYYYQIFKLLSYTQDSSLKTIALFNEYSKKYKTHDFLDNWALYYRMNAEENDTKENYLAAQVFARGTDNKFNIQWHFNKNIPINEVLKFAKTNEEKANIYVLYSFKKTDQNLENIEKIQKLDSKNVGLSFLILREVNKIEDWILTPSYTMYLPVLREDYWENSNEQRILNRVEIDREYAAKLLGLINNIDLNKVEDKNFFLLSKSYLEFLTKDYNTSLKTIALLEKHSNNENFKRQLNIVKALSLTANQEKNKAIIVDEIKKTIIKEYTNKNYSFLFAIAKELEVLNNNVDASFLISQIAENEYGPNHVFWKSKTGKITLYDDYYSDWYGYIDAELSSTELQSLVLESNNNNSDLFEVWKKKIIKNNSDKINDLLGIKYMRENNLKMAYHYFSKMSKTHYTNELFNENPFYKIKSYTNFNPKENNKNLTKASVTLTLINHLKQAELSKNKNRDIHYFLAANCYYNMSYHGNSWMMKRIYWTSNKQNSKMNDEEEYLSCNLAKEYYLKAHNISKNKKTKALCAYMIGKCNLRKAEYLELKRNLYNDFNFYHGIPDSKEYEIQTKNAFNFLLKNYPDEYDDLTSNCEMPYRYFNAEK